MRVRVNLEFCGTHFGGWQLQSEVRESTHPTIQGHIERCMGIIFNSTERIAVVGCGRTDAGVHARDYVAHFDWPEAAELPSLEELEKFRHKINSLLPQDIVITSLCEAPNFHACDHVVAKVYEYKILLRRAKPTLQRGQCWWIPIDPATMEASENFNFSKLEQALALIRGTHDFAAFMAAHSSVKTTVRTLFKAESTQEWLDESQKSKGLMVTLRFEGNGFLRHMVRNLVGTLVEAATGAREPSSLLRLMGEDSARVVQNRTQAGFCAPAEGLFLAKIIY